MKASMKESIVTEYNISLQMCLVLYSNHVLQNRLRETTPPKYRL